ncbi:MAG: rod shape-determining protein MreC [Burkholderiales bacterium]
MEYTPPPFFRRGPGLLTRLGFFTLLSLVLLYADARFQYMEVARKVVATLIYPLQQLTDLPGEAGNRIGEFFVSQAFLKRENERLQLENFISAGQVQTQLSLLAENRHLRELLDMRTRFEGPSVVAEILFLGRDPFSRSVVIDKGSTQKIEEGSAVVDESGLIGQVSRVFPWAAEVALITDREQVVPVQIVRNGMRAVVFGSGSDNSLELRFLPVNVDIENGDVLVTSGIDSVYPAGLPVAVVSNIERNAAYSFARISCEPSASPDSNRQVLVLARLSPPPEYPTDAKVDKGGKRPKNRKGG